MNRLSQTGVITSLNTDESPWNNLFYAHPHLPWPLSLLPRGEGEMVAASWQKGGVLVHGCKARLFRGNLTLTLLWGEGTAVGRLVEIRGRWSRRLAQLHLLKRSLIRHADDLFQVSGGFHFADHEMGHVRAGDIKSTLGQGAISDAVSMTGGTVGEPGRTHDGPVKIILAHFGFHAGHVGNHLTKQGGLQHSSAEAQAFK